MRLFPARTDQAGSRHDRCRSRPGSRVHRYPRSRHRILPWRKTFKRYIRDSRDPVACFLVVVADAQHDEDSESAAPGAEDEAVSVHGARVSLPSVSMRTVGTAVSWVVDRLQALR